MQASHRLAQVTARVGAGVLGGWLFTWGSTTLGIALLVAAGMPYGEARTFLYLLAFVVFLVAFLWAFASASVLRVWLVLGGGGAAMTVAAWLTARALT
jgi:hypothetical protein